MCFYIILLVISVTLTLNSAANYVGIPHEDKNYEVSVRRVEEAYMLCVNGSKYVRDDIEEDELDLIFTHRPMFTYCDKRLSYQKICHLLEEYKNCSFNLVECKRIPSRNMEFCYEKHLTVNDPAQPVSHYEEYPISLENTKDSQEQSFNITAIDQNPSKVWRAKMKEIATKDASIENIEADEKTHNETTSDTHELPINVSPLGADEKTHNVTASEAQEEALNSLLPGKSAHIRKARQIQYCRYPTNLKTSDLICRRYPSKVKCVQKCVFGYTLNEGISRKMECLFSENKWNPIGFEECRPFLDCTMTLISSGELACYTPTTRKAPTCNVTCDAYEDKPATRKETYECKVSGAWSRKLPFCVVSGSGLDLVPAPRIKLHPMEDKPETKKKHNKKMKKTTAEQ